MLLNIKQNLKSFLNVFFKNIVLRLIAVCLISAFVLTYIPDYMEKQYKEVVEKECAKSTLRVAEIIDMEMREEIYENTINVELAKLQNTINEIPLFSFNFIFYLSFV